MSGELDYIARGLSERLELRRQMLRHLGLEPPAPDTKEMRDTVMACCKCARPAICRGWMKGGFSGVPMFCKARHVFLQLGAANEDTAPRH